MCSGKSTTGRLLAQKLSWPHFDTDEMVEKQVGASIAEIIKAQGEPAFRQVEKTAIQLVAPIDKIIISTGGGAPLDEENMAALSSNASVIWLKVSPETVLRRAGNFRSRPLIDAAHPLESIKRRMTEREVAYKKAHHTIETDNLKPAQIADRILETLALKK